MSIMSWIRRAALPAAALIAAACGESTAPEPAVASVEITTTGSTMYVGDSMQFAARALTHDGILLPDRAPTWSSSNDAVVTVSPQGRAIAVSPGLAVLRAAVDGKHDEAALTVSVAPVASIALSHAAVSLPEFGTQQVTALPRDAAGRPLDGRPVVWASADTSVATVDAQGRITAQAVGVTTVSVAIEGATTSVAVTVTPADVASITVSPAPIVVGVLEAEQLTAIVKDAGGNVLTGRTITWTAEPAGLVAVDATGRVVGLGHGYAQVVATSGGKTFTVAVTVENGEADDMPFDLIYHRSAPGILGEIVLLSTTSGARRTLNAGNVSRQPTPSPDGTRIAFYVSQRELGTGEQIDDIFAVDVNGMNMKRLTAEAGFDGDPAWSPDGTRIAYRRIEPGLGRSTIWVMNADGSNKVRLTADMEATHTIGAPHWSPDGTRIAFDAWSTSTGTVAGIWTMKPDGSDKRQHTSTTTGFDQGATWSPDGERIAFTRSYGDDTDISIVALGTGAVTRLALPGRQWGAAWSPDGGHLAFWQPIGYQAATAIFTVRVDGTNARRQAIDPVGGSVYDPEWIKR